jgi:hypothetical protein
VDLFGRKMDREGIRTVGTVERVWVPQSKFDTGTVQQECGIDIVVSFTDQQGVVYVKRKTRAVLVNHLLTPGCEIEVRYMPDNPDKWDFFSTGVPDQRVARGWGAGIFEVEDIGERHTHKLFGVTAGSLVGIGEGGIDEQRDMFRRGPIVPATIVDVSCVSLRRVTTGAHEYTLTLRAEGRDYQTTAFIPGKAVPQSGDVVKIVIGADGRRIALDSDERYVGPPGQALVSTTPPEVAAQREPVFSIRDYIEGSESKLTAVQERNQAGLARHEADMAAYRAGETPPPSSADVSPQGAASTDAASASAEDNPLVAQLSEQIAAMKRARRQMGKHYERMVRAKLDGQRIAGLIDDAAYEQLLQEALSE